MELDCFPYPIAVEGSAPFWDACNRCELQMQRCQDCERYRWMPDEFCPQCGSPSADWSPLSGRGYVTTWTVITHSVHPAAASRIPYIVVEVEIEEQRGLRMISNLVEIAPESVVFNQRGSVTFQSHPSGQKLPLFRPVAE